LVNQNKIDAAAKIKAILQEGIQSFKKKGLAAKP
jgi:hypothetical protein